MEAPHIVACITSNTNHSPIFLWTNHSVQHRQPFHSLIHLLGSLVSYEYLVNEVLVINVPFCPEDAERMHGGARGDSARCTPFFPSSLYGKKLTSLLMLVLLCVLNACTGFRFCVLFHTFLRFAFSLLTPRGHRMMSWVLCVHGNFIWHALSLCKLQSVASHLLPKGSVKVPHNRPQRSHTGYFRKHVRARGSVYCWSIQTVIKIPAKPVNIKNLLCCLIAPAEYSATKWVAWIVQPIHSRISSNGHWWPTLTATFRMVFLHPWMRLLLGLQGVH